MVLDGGDQRNIDALHEALTDIEKEQNIVNVREFVKFSKLFVKDNKLSTDEITELSNQFITRFNPYDSIDVVDDTGSTIFTIPQLFTPIRSISEEYINLVDRFRKDGNSDVPKYSADAAKGLLFAISKSQIRDDDYCKTIIEMRHKYADDLKKFEQLKSNISDDTPTQKTSDITSMDGLSWE